MAPWGPKALQTGSPPPKNEVHGLLKLIQLGGGRTGSGKHGEAQCGAGSRLQRRSWTPTIDAVPVSSLEVAKSKFSPRLL